MFVTVCVVNTASAFDVKVKGTTYPIRWGDSEQNDLVSPYPVYGNPICSKRGSTMTLSLDDPQNEVNHWRVIYARLASKVDGTIYWAVAESPQTLHPSSDDIPLGAAPNKVDYAELQVTCKYLLNEIPASRHKPAQKRRYVTRSINLGTVALEYHMASSARARFQQADPHPLQSTSEVFVVLDTPKAPMAPAWVSVLEESCVWASGATTDDEARRLLTETLFASGHYNGGNTQFSNLGGNIFYLKFFLEGSRYPDGQCDDFANYLVSLVNSVGSAPLQTQRSNQNNGQRVFWTQYIKPAGLGGQASQWRHHQFAVAGTDVWDGCVAFFKSNYSTEYADPVKMTQDPTYKNKLVNFGASGPPDFAQWFVWTPQTAVTPSVTTAPHSAPPAP